MSDRATTPYPPDPDRATPAEQDVIEHERLPWFTQPVRQVLVNSSYLLLSQGVTLVLSLFASALMMRKLGPERLGVLNLAIGLVVLVLPIVDLGLRPLLVRRLTLHPEESRSWLFSAALMQLAAAVVVVVGVFITGATLWGTDSPSWLLLFVLVWLAPLEVLSVFVGHFDSRMEGKAIVRGELAGAITAAAGRLLAVWLLPSLTVFALVFVLGTAVRGLVWLAQANRQHLTGRWETIKKSQAADLFKDAMPYLVASVGGIVMLKADIVMLGSMRSDAEVGQYSAAVMFYDVAVLLPCMVIRSATPALLKLHKQNPALYTRRRQTFHNAMTWFAIVVGLAMGLAGPVAVRWVLGKPYAEAGQLLGTLALAYLFTVQGVMVSVSVLADNLQRYQMATHVLAALLNVVLNVLWIPRFGPFGAAWASIVSYALVVYLPLVVYPAMWPILRSVLRSFLAPVEFTLGVFNPKNT